MRPSDEWARRQLIREDVQRDLSLRRFYEQRERERAFRAKHPVLARVWYGKAVR